MKDSLIIYTKFDEQVSLLSDAQAGVLLRALISYQMDKELPKMDGITNMIFTVIRQQVDYDNQKYDDVCTARKLAGAQGGRPSKSLENKGNKPKKPNGFDEKAKKTNGCLEKQTKAKKAESESDNESDIIPPLYPPQGVEGEDFQGKFFSVYCQFKKFANGRYPQIDFEKLLAEFDKSAQLRRTFSWQVILDSYDGIVAGNFRDKVDETAAGRELMADRERWYTARREKAERKAEETYKRFMQDETFKGIERRLKELMPEMARLEVASDKGDFKAKQRLVKLTQEQGRLRQQRLGIIEMNGKTEDDLVAQYGCKKCNDTGYTEDGRLCDCYKGE
jgi:hypothetical protein